MKKFKKGSLLSFAVTLAIIAAVLANSLLFSTVLANDGLSDEIIPETLTEVGSLLPEDGEPVDEPVGEPIDEPIDEPSEELNSSEDKYNGIYEDLVKTVLGKLTALGIDMTSFSLDVCFPIDENETQYQISFMSGTYFDAELVEEYFANSKVERYPEKVAELKERALNDDNEMLVDSYSVYYDAVNDNINFLVFCHGIKNIVYGGYTNIDAFVIQ